MKTMPCKILRLILKGRKARTIFETLELLKYTNSLRTSSREWKYFYQVSNKLK